MADLGDLSGLLKEGTLTNLDWLDVDEQSYRELDRLPKKNLDFAPELEAAWAHEDKPASAYLVPNNQKARTMLEVGQASYADTGKAASQIMRTARVHMMQDPDPRKLLSTLISKFGKTAVSTLRGELTQLLQERGLLGRYYMAAADFQNCHQASKPEMAFARRFASEARFVVACERCTGCVHNGGSTCGVFQKKIVVDVPYSPDLASQIEQVQAGRGKSVQASTATPKERIRLALLSDDVHVGSAPGTPKPVEDPARLLNAVEAPKKVHLPVLGAVQQQALQEQLAWQPTAADGKTASANSHRDKVAVDVVKLLSKEMLRGRSESELMQAMKLSFSLEDLRATRERWEPLFKEAGLYGTVYSTQDSFDDCHEGADFLARNASSIKGIVAGGRCQGCIHNKAARCHLYGRPLVAKAEDLYTPEVLAQTVREQRLAGRIGSDPLPEIEPRDALKIVHRIASAKASGAPIRSYMTAFAGSNVTHSTGELTKREVVKVASRFLNEGLYGSDLLAALRRRFDPRDIKAASEGLRTVLGEQGLQGIYYVDPMVYADYGRGCDEGSRLHRARVVPYVKMGSKCATCVLQTSPGQCSKYAKPIVAEPPYSDKRAQQREILASGKATEVAIPDLFDSRTILAQFEMQAEIQVDLKDILKTTDLAVELGTGQVKL